MSETTLCPPTTLCLHCQQPAPDDASFCCNGCEMVYGLLNRCGLTDYYSLRERLGQIRPARPVTLHEDRFDWLDDPAKPCGEMLPEGGRRAGFYLEGVHCAACVWLIEQLPRFVPDVSQARLDLNASTVTLTLVPDGQFAAAADLLQRWGYPPHLLETPADAERHARRDQTLLLSRIGVAAFSAGNLMILAVALYAGVEGTLARYFEWLSLALVLPAVTFSAWPFYRQAWGQWVHSRQIGLDVPIALSLLLGSLGGVYQLAMGGQQLYFDSLAMLVFLLLLSRYTLMRTQRQVLGQPALLRFYTPETVTLLSADGPLALPVERLQVGMCVEVAPGQRLPADGVVLSGESRVDQAVLTGEPFPLPVAPGDPLFCGTTNQQHPLQMRVTACAGGTRLGQILEQAQLQLDGKTRLVRLADRLARYFVAGVLLLSALLLVIFAGDVPTGLNRVLALAIISCPCALGLATPLIVQLSLRRALHKGYCVRSPESLERLPGVRELVFDKTGTLTAGRFELLLSSGLEDPEVRQALLALESQSRHPVALALTRHLLAEGPVAVAPVKAFEILPTGGIQGWVKGQLWRVVPDSAHAALRAEGAELRLLIQTQGQTRATLVLGDALRPEAPAVMAELQAQGYTCWLLSGDQREACQRVGSAVGLPPEQVLSRQTPEDKARFLAAHPDAAMIGDGLNDILALSQARVGISVQGAAAENLAHADLYLAGQGVGQLPGLLRHARLTRRLLTTALGFSLLYNLLGISAAVAGAITPLTAAILMPLSALTVFSLALIGGQRLCKS
ncbi:MAG: heavy metal translocating P-type ATPase [Candidatus Sericytochromatia bacterium]